MKWAPNVKKIPKDPYTEAVIFAGADAWSHAEHWQAGNPAKDTVPPVVLDKKQLAELGQLHIVDEGRRCVRVYPHGFRSDISQSYVVLRASDHTVTGIACLSRLPLMG